MSVPLPKISEISQKEVLLSLTALIFVEEHRLLPDEKLVDAKDSLRALFLHTSGEETLLRKLIDTLKTTRSIQRSFAQIANILEGMYQSAASVDKKISALKAIVDAAHISAEENTAFVGQFLSFSQTLDDKIAALMRALETYVQAKEEEARVTGIYRIANEARERIKQRLAGGLGTELQSAAEHRIKKEVVSSVDFSTAESDLKYAKRDSQSRKDDVKALLVDIKAMCQQATNPATREHDNEIAKAAAAYDDIFSLFSLNLRKFPQLLRIKDSVIELFKMYQHAHGMFHLDFHNLQNSIAAMTENPGAYFESKEEDLDIRSKREKLRCIEGLIPFLERGADLLLATAPDGYSKFSQRLSEAIATKNTPWAHIDEALLRSKIHAEAELNTKR